MTAIYNKTILCVDDDPEVLDSYRQVLTSKKDALDSILDDVSYAVSETHSAAEYNLLLADSGEEALNILQVELKAGRHIAAGFFDIRMPGGMDGFETIRAIRKLAPDIYCAVVTAYTDRDPDLIRSLFGSDYQDHFLYFNKPFSTVALEQTAVNLVAAWNKQAAEMKTLQLLQEAKNDWQDAFDTINDAITIHDLDYNIIRANKTAKRLYGSHGRVIEAKKCFRSIHGTEKPAPECLCQTVLKTKSRAIQQLFEPNLKKHLEIKVLPRFDENHRLYGFVHIARDVTEKVNSRRALESSEERFENLAQLLPVAVYEVDQGGKITFFNQCASEMFGYSKDDLARGVRGLDLLAPSERQRAAENLNLRAQGMDLSIIEYQGLKKDGSIFPIFTHASTIMDGDNFIGCRGVVVDITERKLAEDEKNRLQEQFRQAQKMEAIGTLAGGIAHDFNNILSAIMGYTELTLLSAPDNGAIKSNLSEVMKAAERAHNLVKQILTFSRQHEQERQPIQICLIIKEAMKLLRASIPTTIEFKVNIAAEGGFILADATQIHQIVMNLCTNAYHAMRAAGGGLLTVELAEVTLNDDAAIPSNSGGLAPGQYMKLTISDTGTGIKEEIIEQIFDPYFTTKPTGEGTGMGLALVNGIVESYHGKIILESKLGEGTTFKVYLPCLESDEDRGSIVEEKKTIPKGSERIFLIDDEETIVKMAREMLLGLGYHVTSFSNCDKALQVFFSQPDAFDLVITDLTMPQMNGLELAKEILALRPDIPVILCTGFSEEETKQKAKKLGIKGFLMKPISLKELSIAIREALA